MSAFVWLAYLLAIIGTLSIGVLFIRARQLFVRPTMQLVSLVVVFFSWPVAVLSPDLEVFLPDPYAVLMILAVFVVCCMLWSSATLRQETRETWHRLTRGGARAAVPSGIEAAVLLTVCAAIVFAYLRTVPFDQTGLFIAFVNPAAATQAREESLKLIEAEGVKYAFSLLANTIAPLLAVGLALRAARGERGPFDRLIAITGIPAIAVAVSLTGARSFAVALFVSIAVAFWMRAAMPVRPLLVLVVGPILMAPFVVLTLAREGRAFDALDSWSYLASEVAKRVFEAPVGVGVAYIHFAQSHGWIGLQAIPKLAQLWGEPGLDVPNLIGLAYFEATAASISANAGFLFSYYAYFGTGGLVASVICACALDLVLYSYRWISDSLLLPCVAILATTMLALLSIDFTVVLVTQGFMIVPVFCIALSRVRVAGRDRA